MKRSTALDSILGSALTSVLALALGVVFVAPAAAQNCSNVSYRLWTQQGETWYQLGETVEIESGREGHVYLHVDSRSKNPYTAKAEIGYPEKFGFGGRSTEVVKHVRMQAQTGDDRARGRIRFDASQPGTTQLGFRLTGVRSPGSLDLVAPPCRTGVIPIRVAPRGGEGDGDGGEEPGMGAAEQLVARLYTGLLRRDEPGRIEPSFVAMVRRSARDGVLSVAETMMQSDEFRREALRRTEEAHGRSSLDELRRVLLGDIYRDLYGYAEPDRQGREDDLRDLESCLAGRAGNEACSRLGRELVDRRQFYEHNRELIDAVSGEGRRGRGRR